MLLWRTQARRLRGPIFLLLTVTIDGGMDWCRTVTAIDTDIDATDRYKTANLLPTQQITKCNVSDNSLTRYPSILTRVNRKVQKNLRSSLLVPT